jgi:hypothetical protein
MKVILQFQINNFQVVEQGSHDELLALGGYYYSLVTADPTMTQGKHILVSVVTRSLYFNFFMALQALVDQGLLTVEPSQSQSFRHTTLSRTPLDGQLV